MNLLKWLTFILYAGLSTAGLFLMKIGLSSTSFHVSFIPNISVNLNYRLVLGTFLYVVSFVTWLTIIRHSSLSVAYPIGFGLIQFFLLLASLIFLHQRLSLYSVMGSILVLSGIFLMAVRS